MKKIILSIVLVCFCIVAHAAHLKFMGIPITGTITAFQSKLQTKGGSVSLSVSEASSLKPVDLR